MLSRKAGREAQAIKELGNVLSACAHGADTAAGVEAGGTVAGGLSARPQAVIGVVSPGAGGRAGLTAKASLIKVPVVP